MPTSAQLIEFDGVSQRAESVRFDVLDQALVKQGTISPSKGQVPQIVNSASRTVARTLQTLHLTVSDAANIDTIRHRIQPVWILEDGSEWPLGVFLFGQTPRSRHSYGLEMDATLLDQTFIIDQGIGASVSYAAGASIFVALTEQAQIAGFPSVQITPTTAQVGGPMSWAVGTSRYQIMAELCKVAGYLAPYFNNSGVLIARPAPDLSQMPTLLYNGGGRIKSNSMVETDNLVTAPNRYIVVGSGNTSVPAVGIFDIPSSSPVSFLNRGFLIANPPVNLQGITDSAAAAVAAQALYVSDPNRYFLAEWDALPDPRHDTWDVLQYLGNTMLETEWRLPCAPGASHHHIAKRVYS